MKGQSSFPYEDEEIDNMFREIGQDIKKEEEFMELSGGINPKLLTERIKFKNASDMQKAILMRWLWNR